MTWMDQQGQEYEEYGGQWKVKSTRELDYTFFYFLVCLVVIVWIVDYWKKKPDGAGCSHHVPIPHESCSCHHYRHATARDS